ncbi:MAG: hypothetical protein AAF996_17460 [Pseudomonadota bacterium]
MGKPRANIRLSHKAHALLEEMTRAPGVNKSAIMEAALWAYVDERQLGGDKAAVQRLERMELRVNAIERDTALIVETLGQFILYWLTRTEPLPEGERDAAHRLGQRRFDYFIEQVAGKLDDDAGLAARIFSGARDDMDDVSNQP